MPLISISSYCLYVFTSICLNFLWSYIVRLTYCGNKNVGTVTICQLQILLPHFFYLYSLYCLGTNSWIGVLSNIFYALPIICFLGDLTNSRGREWKVLWSLYLSLTYTSSGAVFTGCFSLSSPGTQPQIFDSMGTFPWQGAAQPEHLVVTRDTN